jgi:hypothetical protein
MCCGGHALQLSHAMEASHSGAAMCYGGHALPCELLWRSRSEPDDMEATLCSCLTCYGGHGGKWRAEACASPCTRWCWRCRPCASRLGRNGAAARKWAEMAARFSAPQLRSRIRSLLFVAVPVVLRRGAAGMFTAATSPTPAPPTQVAAVAKDGSGKEGVGKGGGSEL